MLLKNNLSEVILQRLTKNSTYTNVGLLNGLAGESLYFFYRSYLFDEEASFEKAVAKLHKVIEAVENDFSHANFYNGIAGIGWMISHLNKEGIVEIDIEDFLDTSVDTFLYQQMISCLNKNLYDFFYGASGICYYFINRYATTENKILKENYKNYIIHFLFYMEYNGVNDSNGMHWKHNYYPFENDGISYQLSSQTNISAVIMILVEIISLHDFNPICIPLLEKSSNWLINSLENSQQVTIDQALSLWKASSVLHDRKLEEKSLELLKNITSSLNEESGISLFKYALIYKKIGQQKNHHFFTEKAKEYFKKAAILFANEDNTDLSIWKGNSGVGLADLTFSHDLNMEWTKCMLI